MAGSMTSGKFWHSEAGDVRGAMNTLRAITGFVLLSILPVCGFAQQEKLPANDLPQNFKAPVQQTDFDKRVVMIPMRDGTEAVHSHRGAKGSARRANSADADSLQRGRAGGPLKERAHDRSVAAEATRFS